MHTKHKWNETSNETTSIMNTPINHLVPPLYSAKNQHRQVSFYCAAPHAKSVDLIGDFNHWQPFPMQRSVDGWWTAQLELSHGHHQYRFLVDGQPMLDPQATGVVRDEHNEKSSLVAVS
jgi:1,4-alpha-glucan branching enzyme